MAGFVEVPTWFEKREIWFGFVEFIKTHWHPHGHMHSITKQRNQIVSCPIDRGTLRQVHWAHLDNLAVNELAANVVHENSDFSHRVKLVDGEPFSHGVRLHVWSTSALLRAEK